MKRLWLVVIFAVSILPGCMAAMGSPDKYDCEGYNDDCDDFLDDYDDLFDLFDGYYENKHGYEYEEDQLLSSILPGN